MYYLNGELFELEPLGDDFFYGYSIFETMYGLKGKLIFLNEHLARLQDAMSIVGIKTSYDLLLEINNFMNKCKKYEEFFLKIQISNKNLYIKMEEFEGRHFDLGIKCEIIKNFYQNELGFLKSGNYLGNILARKQLSSFEGIFTNRNGILTEGTISNLFFIKDKIVYTPSLDLNILNGIIRKKIIEICKKSGIMVQEGHFKLEDIKESDGIFFTNSLMKRGLIWVSQFENITKIKTSEIHKIEKEYLKILNDMI